MNLWFACSPSWSEPPVSSPRRHVSPSRSLDASGRRSRDFVPAVVLAHRQQETEKCDARIEVCGSVKQCSTSTASCIRVLAVGIENCSRFCRSWMRRSSVSSTCWRCVTSPSRTWTLSCSTRPARIVYFWYMYQSVRTRYVPCMYCEFFLLYGNTKFNSRRTLPEYFKKSGK